MLRVNEWEWDIRWREFADEITYRRCIIVPAASEEQLASSMPVGNGMDTQTAVDQDGDGDNSDDDAAELHDADGDTDDDNDDEDDGEDEEGDAAMQLQPQSPDSPTATMVEGQTASATAVHGRRWRVEAVMVDIDSGVYSVNHGKQHRMAQPVAALLLHHSPTRLSAVAALAPAVPPQPLRVPQRRLRVRRVQLGAQGGHSRVALPALPLRRVRAAGRQAYRRCSRGGAGGRCAGSSSSSRRDGGRQE